jgi:hypothetical protein
VTPEDGTKLLIVTPTEHDNLQFPLIDPKIKPNDYPLADNQVYYYSVFVKSASSSAWIRAAETMAMSVKDYGTTDFMYNTLPASYRVTAYNTGLVDVTETNTDLVKFLNIFAFEYDSFKAAAENMGDRYNVAKLDGRLVPLMMQQLGLNYEAELGISQGRRLLRAFARNSTLRGTAGGLKSFVTAFSGYNCTINDPINLMLNVDDSSFENSIGSWTRRNTVLTAISRYTSTAWAQSASGEPANLQAASMRVVGSTVVIGNQTVSYSSPNVTITTAGAHGFVAGDIVTVTGVTPSGYNGTWTAAAGTTGSTLVLPIGSNPGNITGTPGSVAPKETFLRCGDTAPLTKGIPVTAGVEYFVSAWTKAASGTVGVALGLRWCDRLGATISETIGSPSTNSTDWGAVYSSGLTAPAKAVFAVPVIKFNNPLTGSAATQYVDAIQVTTEGLAVFAEARRVDIALLPNRTNLVMNPQFSSTSLWYNNPGWGTTPTAVGLTTSSNKLRCLSTIDVSTSDLLMAVIDSYVTVGSTYTFSVNLHSPATTAADAFTAAGVPKLQAYAVIKWIDSGNDVISTSTSATSVPLYYGDNAKFAQNFVTGTAPAEAVYASAAIYVTSTDNAAISGVKPEVYLSKPLFEEAAGVLPYFDGDLATVDPAAMLTTPSLLAPIPTQTPTGIGTATLTTSLPHHIIAGQTVVISGVTPSAYNGAWISQAGTTGSTLVLDVSKAFGNSALVPDITVAGTAAVYSGDAATIVNSLDTAWGAGGANDDNSYYYLNKSKVIQRLKAVLPDVLPMSAPWVLRVDNIAV